VLMAIALLTLRRGALGRVLIAMRDSPAACGTLGLDMRWFRVGLFGLSAGMAGLAGALYAGHRGTVGAADFYSFSSLTLLLLAVVFGVTSVTGAALGGLGLMLLPVMQSDNPSVAGLIFAIIGFGAVALGRDPNGLANYMFRFGRWAQARATQQLRESLPDLSAAQARGKRRADEPDAADAPADAPDSEEVPVHVSP